MASQKVTVTLQFQSRKCYADSKVKVTVTLQFQSRKSEVEIESVIKRIDLCRIAKEQLCFEEDDVILKQYEEKSKKWEEIAAKEPNDELTLKDGAKLKLKSCNPDQGLAVEPGRKYNQVTCGLPEQATITEGSFAKTSRECACYAAYLPKNTLWKGTDGNMKKELTVYFFEDTDNVLENLHYNYNPLTPEVIMKIVQNNWKIEDEHGKYVPKFVRAKLPLADIRVKFSGTGGSWSMLGSDAEKVAVNKPTVVLKLNNMDYYNIRATIVHEFGHALGLGHEHQHPDYWRIIKKFLNLKDMKADLQIKDKEFEYQWTNTNPAVKATMSNYDENSVMHYHTKLFWLKDPKYQVKKDLQDLKDKGEISEEEYKCLKGFHRHVNFIRDAPSMDDKQKLGEAYHNLYDQLIH